jgi:hypothetical protein
MPYLKHLKTKKSIKKKKEEQFKHNLLNFHPEFIDMYREFKKDQEEKRKNGYSSDLLISDGGYITDIYGKSIFVYDQYFENSFYQQFNKKYDELVKNPRELEKVREMIPQLT